MPRSVLYDLNSLVPCTTLGYHTFDAYRGTEFTTRTLGTDIDPEIEFPDTDGTKWARFWACGCSYPERTRDLVTVRPGSSFPIDSELAAEDRELIRADGLEFDVVIPLRPAARSAADSSCGENLAATSPIENSYCCGRSGRTSCGCTKSAWPEAHLRQCSPPGSPRSCAAWLQA